MKIAALVGLIDEVDVIGACLEHHLSIGFDKIYVTDLGSKDGSLEVVQEFAKNGRVHVLTGQQGLAESAWPQKMLQFAIVDMAPDYVAHIDPDEYWLPRGRNIKNIKGLGEADAFIVTRYNAVQLREDHSVGRVLDSSKMPQQLVFAERPRLSADSPPRVPVYSGAIGPKVMHRGLDVKVGLGWHSVDNSLLSRQVTPDDVVVLHYPLTSYDGFQQKLRNISEYFEANPQLAAGIAWHWRRMLAAQQVGELEEEWKAQSLPQEVISESILNGKIVPINSIYPFLSEWNSSVDNYSFLKYLKSLLKIFFD